MAVPVVSVLMGVRDGAAWLSRAIASVFAQTLPDLELVVVDDGSTDGTAALLAGFARRMRAATRANGIEVEFCGRSDVVRGLQRAGFLRRDIMCPLVLDRQPDKGEAAAERLYFTKFDRVSD